MRMDKSGGKKNFKIVNHMEDIYHGVWMDENIQKKNMKMAN
jgi:hypothetical protein